MFKFDHLIAGLLVLSFSSVATANDGLGYLFGRIFYMALFIATLCAVVAFAYCVSRSKSIWLRKPWLVGVATFLGVALAEWLLIFIWAQVEFG